MAVALTALTLSAAANRAQAAECSTTGMGCCGGMTATEATPTADSKVVADALTTCPVSGEKLGEMGAPYTFTYQNQEVKLCCSGCKKKFDKDPEKYVKIIRAADPVKK